MINSSFIHSSAHHRTGMLVVTIDKWPPSVNHMYMTVKFGKRRMKPEVETWHLMAKQQVKSQIEAQGFLTLTVPCRVWIDLHGPSDGRRARFDVDNKAKPLLDVLKHSGAIEDDDLVAELMLRKYACPEGIKRDGLVEIALSAI